MNSCIRPSSCGGKWRAIHCVSPWSRPICRAVFFIPARWMTSAPSWQAARRMTWPACARSCCASPHASSAFSAGRGAAPCSCATARLSSCWKRKAWPAGAGLWRSRLNGHANWPACALTATPRSATAATGLSRPHPTHCVARCFGAPCCTNWGTSPITPAACPAKGKRFGKPAAPAPKRTSPTATPRSAWRRSKPARTSAFSRKKRFLPSAGRWLAA